MNKEIKPMIKLDFAVAEIIEIYNSVPKILTNKVVKVAVDPSRLSSDSKIPMLTEQKNGNYWIVLVEDDTYWLLPKHGIRINQFNLETVRSLFDCQEYQLSEHGDFILLQPAEVTIMPDGKEWRLDTKGILNFDPSYPAAESRARIQQARQEIDRLQSELAETKKQNEQLNARVAELAYDKLQNIPADLVTRDEFTAQSQQLDSLEETLKTTIQRVSQLEKSMKDESLREKPIDSKSKKYSPPQRKEEREQPRIAPRSYYSEPVSPRPARSVSTFSNSQWVDTYNRQSTSLSLTEVSPTEESLNNRRLGSRQPIILETSRRGHYGIYIDGNENYLVPSQHFRITQNNYKTVEVLFECRNYTPDPSGTHSSGNFKLLKPAIVYPITGGKSWQLYEPGILQF
ncbi:hypothetical protein V0288_04785 [Pannus brasiliensis CCIBt3594]|uniref:FHA domain-containing protein n=1 Tax=Pannus brasiliensis CCIBt3594 TaxID=1427578 RepID=A0AAW9QF44_9CHRO